MNSQDKKEIVGLMGEALEQVVIPRFQKIEDRLDDIEETLQKHTIKFKDIEETLEYHGDKLERIDSRLNAEINRKDDLSVMIENHEKRLTKVEAKVA